MPDIAGLLVLLLLIAVLLRLDFAFYLIYLALGTFLLARWWTDRLLAGLRVRRVYADHAFLGEPVDVELRIDNARWWPVPWLRLDETLPANLAGGQTVRRVLSLGPREHARLQYQVLGQRRGYYSLGPLLLNGGDLFGFAEVQGRTNTNDHLTVYPRVIPLAQVDLSSRASQGALPSRQRLFADPARTAGKREYKPGDPLRTIDWKSSARTASLQVKKFDPSVSLPGMIFLNLHGADYDRRLVYYTSEWGVVVAASLASYLAGQRQAVGLASNGRDPLNGCERWQIEPRSGRGHLMRLLEWLARVELVPETPLPFAEWLPTAALGLGWGTTVIVITPVGDDAICAALHRLARAGLNPVLLVLQPGGQMVALQQRGRRLGFAVHPAGDERDLAAWRSRPGRLVA